MLRDLLRPPIGPLASDRWRDQLRDLERQLAERVLAWEARSAIDAERRCEKIGAAIRRGARRCAGHR